MTATLEYRELSWHQLQAVARGAAAMRSGRDCAHGYRYCDCCGTSVIGPLDDSEYFCEPCDDARADGKACDPANSSHCFTGYCDGSGCSYSGECEGW